MSSMWWIVGYFVLGMIAGGIMAWVIANNRFDHRVNIEAEEKYQEGLRLRQRKLAENGRTRPRHPDATTPARISRARPRQRRVKP